MNFDVNALANIAKLFGNMPNGAEKQPARGQNSPQNAQNRRDAAEYEKIHTNSPFASQNGLYEQVDASSFENIGEKTDKDSKKQTPFDNILNLMSKKSELDKMMPAFKNIFSKQQAAKTASVENKEKSKPKDVFSPIEFAGYTVVCAMNRLYFSIKNL